MINNKTQVLICTEKKHSRPTFQAATFNLFNLNTLQNLPVMTLSPLKASGKAESCTEHIHTLFLEQRLQNIQQLVKLLLQSWILRPIKQKAEPRP